MTLDEEEAMLLEEQSLLTEQADLNLGDTKQEFAPEANRDPVPFEETGVTPEDLQQAQSVNLRQLNQLQGKTTPLQSAGDISAQALSYFPGNAIRSFFGKEEVGLGNFINPIEEWQTDNTQRAIKAAEAGIHSGEGVSPKSRAIGSLGINNVEKAKAGKNELDARFNTDVKVGVDQKSGDAVYLNPLNDQIYQMNPIGVDWGDLTEFTGEAIKAVPEVMATILAGKKKITNQLTGKVNRVRIAKQEIAAGSGGVTVGEGLKLGLGKLLGINQDMTLGDVAIAAGLEGTFSAVAGSILESVVSFARKIPIWKEEGVIPGYILDTFKEDLDKIDAKKTVKGIYTKEELNASGSETVDAMNKALRSYQSDVIFAPNVGQVLNDSSMLDIVESIGSLGGAGKRELIEREATNLQAQKEFFTLMNKEVADVNPVGASQLSEDVRQVTDATLNQQRGVARSPLLQAQKAERITVKQIPVQNSFDTGKIVRKALTEEEAAFKKAAKRDYEKIALDADKIGIVPDSDGLTNALLSVDKTGSAFKEAKISDALEADVLERGYKWDVSTINKSIRTLRGMKRAVDTGHSSYNLKKLNDSINVLKEYRVNALKSNPDLLERQLALDALYADGKDLFDKGIGFQILNKKKELADSKIFDNIITNGDSGTAKNVSAAIMDNPEAMMSMRGAIYDLYQTNVVKNGIVNLAAHQAFVDKYIGKRIITPFFKVKELNKLQSVGTIAKVVEREKAQYKIALDKVNSMFEKKLENLDGKGLLNLVWGQEKQTNIIKLQKALKDHPEIWKSVQAETMNEIKKKAISGGVFSVGALETVIENNGGTIKKMLGDGYLSNLTLLKDSLEITARGGNNININTNNAFMDITRSYVGVFTREGRFITAANRFRAASARQLMVDMVLDPSKIRKLSALRRARTGSDTSRLILTQLGVPELFRNTKDADLQEEERISKRISKIKDAEKQRNKSALLNKQKAIDDKISKLKAQQSKLRSLAQ